MTPTQTSWIFRLDCVLRNLMGQSQSFPPQLFTTLVWAFHHAFWHPAGVEFPFVLWVAGVECRSRSYIDICSFQLNICTRNLLNIVWSNYKDLSTEILHSFQYSSLITKPKKNLHMKDHFCVWTGIKYHFQQHFQKYILCWWLCIPEQLTINNAMIHFHIICPAIEKSHCLHVNSCLDESQNFLLFLLLQTTCLNTVRQLNP